MGWLITVAGLYDGGGRRVSGTSKPGLVGTDGSAVPDEVSTNCDWEVPTGTVSVICNLAFVLAPKSTAKSWL
jgi:hypothetical protein